MHVDEDSPLVLLFDQPPGVAEPLIRDVVRVCLRIGLYAILFGFLGRGHARFRQCGRDMLQHFVLGRRLEHARRIGAVVEPQQHTGVSMPLRPRQWLEHRLRKVAKQLHVSPPLDCGGISPWTGFVGAQPVEHI